MITSAFAFLLSVVNSDQPDGIPISTVEIHPRIPPAVTSDDLSTLDGEAVLGPAAITDILGRRRLGLPIPDEYYEQCHFWVNAVRSREGLPALQRWKEFESCTDEMAEYDYFQYDNYGRAHAAMYDGVGCDFYATGASAFSQNSCPMWGNDVDSIKDCTVLMWDEKTDPGVDPGTLNCLGRTSAECGHYYNLRGGSAPGMYNQYDMVACGFYVDPGTERLYINQNFVAGNNFLCGGDENTKPNTNRLVEDCSEVPPDYSGCSGLDGIVEPDYYLYACELVDCDLEYDGPCENRLVNDFDACEHFDITEPDDCTAGRGWRYNHPDSPWYYFSEYCRIPCKTCSCEDKNNGAYGTRAPTPPPTEPCDDIYWGPCEDADPDLCSTYGIASIAPCEYNWAFSGTGGLVVDSCRKSCKMCGCDALPAPVPNPTQSPKDPTPSPTASPTKDPTTSPTASPTKDPTQSPSASPTKDPTSSPTPASPSRDPTEQPESPVPSPTKDPTTDSPACPWKTPTTEDDTLECQDGTFCNGWADGWSCCNDNGGRKRCPVNMPLMCVKTCGPVNCCGDHCCEKDCTELGGEKVCDADPEITPTPTEDPTPSPSSPTRTPDLSLPCDNPQVGVPGGIKNRVSDVDTACECAEQCPGQKGFVYFPKRKRCWCVESYDGNVSSSDATGSKRRLYQLVSQDEIEA